MKKACPVSAGQALQNNSRLRDERRPVSAACRTFEIEREVRVAFRGRLNVLLFFLLLFLVPVLAFFYLLLQPFGLRLGLLLFLLGGLYDFAKFIE